MLIRTQRFHIKWKGYSHIHNTDETYAFLKSYKGFKKVENYIAKVWTVDQYYKDPKVSREELEQYEIDRERVRDLQESYKKVERVLAEKDEGGESHFFCKWTSESITSRSSCGVGREGDR